MWSAAGDLLSHAKMRFPAGSRHSQVRDGYIRFYNNRCGCSILFALSKVWIRNLEVEKYNIAFTRVSIWNASCCHSSSRSDKSLIVLYRYV